MDFKSMKRSSEGWKFILSISSILLITTICFAKSEEENTRPSFLETNETVNEVIDGNIYAIEKYSGGIAPEHPGRTFEKMYFSDGNGKVLKMVDIFPFVSKLKKLDESEHFKSYHSLYRRYEMNGKATTDILILDKTGNILFNKPREKEQLVIWNDSKQEAIMIYPNEGNLEVYSRNGSLISRKKFSNYAYEKKYSEIDEDSDFEFTHKVSRDGGFIAIARSNNNELTLIDAGGNVLFQSKGKAFSLSPVIVDENNRVVLTLQRIPHLPRKYIAYDFSGKLLWSLDAEKYYLKRPLLGNFLNVMEADSAGGHLKINDKHEKVDITNGKILPD